MPDHVRKLAIKDALKGKGDLPIAGLRGLGDVSEISGLLESLERKNHVVRRDRCAVMPFCLCPQSIGGRGIVDWIANCLCEQTIVARDFVKRSHHKRRVNKVD